MSGERPESPTPCPACGLGPLIGKLDLRPQTGWVLVSWCSQCEWRDDMDEYE